MQKVLSNIITFYQERCWFVGLQSLFQLKQCCPNNIVFLK